MPRSGVCGEDRLLLTAMAAYNSPIFPCSGGKEHVRTNVVIDDRLLAQAQRLTGLSTTREVLEEGLKLLVRLKRQEKVKAWRGKLRWDGDLEAMRTDSGQ